jgi:hypothetical protein
MKKVTIFSVIAVLAMGFALNAQSSDSGLAQIIIYKATDKMMTTSSLLGVGMNGFKLAVGEEMIIIAKGEDKDGKEVAIFPTWKADPEMSLIVVEGRSKTVVIKALKAGAPLFVTATYITDDGKKVKGEVMGTIK